LALAKFTDVAIVTDQQVSLEHSHLVCMNKIKFIEDFKEFHFVFDCFELSLVKEFLLLVW
jgi:hypothetical protein